MNTITEVIIHHITSLHLFLLTTSIIAQNNHKQKSKYVVQQQNCTTETLGIN